MSLKARIRKIEKKLTKEDNSVTELSYNGAEPTLEETELALKHAGILDPPWKVMYVPYDFKHDLEYSKITGRTIIRFDEKLGLYYDGEILFKLVKKYNKKKLYSSGSDKIEVIDDGIDITSWEGLKKLMAEPSVHETFEKLRKISSQYDTEGNEVKECRIKP